MFEQEVERLIGLNVTGNAAQGTVLLELPCQEAAGLHAQTDAVVAGQILRCPRLRASRVAPGPASAGMACREAAGRSAASRSLR